MKRFLLGIVIALCASVMAPEETWARRGGGGFSSRSSGSRSSGRSSRSTRSTRSTPRSSSRSKARPTKNQVKRRAYEKAKKSGKAYKTKSAALKGYRSKFKSNPKSRAAFNKKFPTSYSKQPAKRPAHIPQSYQGNTVIYQNGGYGYSSGGAFHMMTGMMLMSTMNNAMLMSHMRTQGYHVGGPPVARESHAGTIFLIVIGCILVILVAGFVYVRVTQ